MHRRMTPVERVIWNLGNVHPVNCAILARVRGRCSVEQMRRAIAAVRERHEMLGIRVAGAGLMNAWLTDEGVPEFSLRVVSCGSREEWIQAVEDDVQQPFEVTRGPLTRFLMAESADGFGLAIVSHHLGVDGLGLGYVLRDILAHLEDPSRTRAVVDAPSMDELVHALQRPQRVDVLKQPGTAWPVRPRPADGFRLLCWSLDEPETARLQMRCRQEQASIHTALGIAYLRALTDLDGTAYRPLFSPVSMRHLLPSLPEGAVGQYFIEIFTWVDAAAGEDFWSVARGLKQDIGVQTQPERLLRTVRFLRKTNVLPNAVMRRILRVTCKPEISLSLSNLGRLSMGGVNGGFEIESIYGLGHIGTLTKGQLIACTVNGKIFLSMSTRASDVPYAEKVVEGLLDHLRQALTR